MMTLKGLTWDHPRGFDPLVACSERYARETGALRVEWTKRSLHAFGAASIEVLAESFDLLVVDHPFMGQAVATGCFHDLRDWIDAAQLDTLVRQGVGQSGRTYVYDGQVLALPTDAAAQVASCRPDLLAALQMPVPRQWSDVEALAERARSNGQTLAWAGCSTDAACTFLSLAANLGHPLQVGDADFLSEAVVSRVMRLLEWLVAHAQPGCLDVNPISVYEGMLASDTQVYCPFGFGYSNYARTTRERWLQFAPLAGPGPEPSRGALLGGAGMAISRHCADPRAAADFMAWLHSAEVQTGPYTGHGGQPGNVHAWRSPEVNAGSRNFFRDTLPVLESAYVRPRFAGVVPFVEEAGTEINRCLRSHASHAQLHASLAESYRRARPATAHPCRRPQMEKQP